MKEKIILIGGGGHCKSCIDVIEQEGRFTIAGIVDMPEKKHNTVLGYSVIGSDEDLAKLIKISPNVLITLRQIKFPTRRMELFNQLKRMNACFPVIVSPHAYVSAHAQVAEGTIVMHHALINAGAKVGKNCIINTKALVEHDALIEDHCHIATGAVVNGGVKIGTGTFIGSIAMSREYIEIGENCVIGGGARYAEPFCRQGDQEELKIAVFGASGFSREVADILLTSGVKDLVFVDLSPKAHQYFGFPICDESDISKLQDQGFCFVIGVGDNQARKKIYEKFPSLPYPNFTHSSASMGFKQFGMLKNKRGNIITAGVRFTNNIQIGDFGIYNLNSTVGHDCMIEDFVNLAPGANISGNVHLKEGAYVGANASILQGKSIDKKLEIGSYATIGAGAVVIKSVQSFDTVVGVPARSKT